ncbi:AAA family ATPase [Mycolicibacterium xanthum]|uniref:AAA family ATPase n=1 Tax=Mycolicibacterium xanthum TaxID=2796469 RepID=UPI0027E168D0|nr:AAA family ATPase [Mycolicibacterium xanthum]
MPVRWVTAPQDPTLEQLERAVRNRAGAVLIGPDGVGKTTLARQAADRVGPDFPRVDRVRATATRPAIPFAAFEHLIDVPETGKTAAVLQAARETLGDGRLLVIDDAHLLDALSAALVYQLAVGGTAHILLTTADDSRAPAEIPALWRDGLVTRIDLHPPGHDDGRLMAQIAEYVDTLPATAQRVLEYLAVADPLTLEDAAALTSAGAVDDAVQSGAVAVGQDGLRPGHPLFLDAVRGALGGPDLRRLRTAVVEQLSTHGAPEVVGRLRLAALAIDSDRPLPATEVCAAAREALRLGDLELSEHLGQSALGRGVDLDARLTVGYALAWQGRGREADAVLAEIDPGVLSEAELMAWALPTAANRFWMLSEPERATAFLRSIRNKVSSPAARTTLDALSATFAMNAGNLSLAATLAGEVLGSGQADDTAIGWAASTAALCAARAGRFAEVDPLAERAMSAGQPGLLRFTSGFAQTTTLALTGEPERALTLARQLTDFAQRRQPGRAIGELLTAEVLIATDDATGAVPLLRDATATLAPTGYSWGPLAWMLLAQALGRLGQPVEAGKALARAESRHGLKSMLFAPELALARAWTAAARRDSHAAVAAAREAARTAERSGQTAMTLRALHDAALLGDPRAADDIGRWCGGLADTAFGRSALAHAAAARGSDSGDRTP